MPPQNQTPTTPVIEGNFTTAAQEIFAGVKERKWLLLQRALLAVWPGLLTVMLAYALWGLDSMGEEIDFEKIWLSILARPWEGWLMGGLAIFSIIYSLLANAILSIERTIWVDSYFDGHKLAPSESLRIAIRLFPSAVHAWLWSFVHYWMVPLLVLVGGVVMLFVGMFQGGDMGVIGFVSLPIAFIIYLVWIFFVRIRVRNFWFLFLDHHDGSRADFLTIASELDRINHETKTKEFAKFIIAEVGVGSVAGLARVVAKLATSAAGATGLINNGALGKGLRIYGDAVARQVQSFAAIIAAYVFYRAARTRLGIGQTINEKVYALAKK